MQHLISIDDLSTTEIQKLFHRTASLKNLVSFVTRAMRDPSRPELQLVAQACLRLTESFYPELIRSYLNSVSVKNG